MRSKQASVTPSASNETSCMSDDFSNDGDTYTTDESSEYFFPGVPAECLSTLRIFEQLMDVSERINLEKPVVKIL